MKILLLASAFRPYSTGGADIAVENTVDGLLGQGHDVVVLTVGYWQGWRSLWPQAQSVPTPRGRLVVYRYYPLNLFSFLTINQRPAWLRLPWHCIDMFNLHAYVVTAKILHLEKPGLVLTHNIKGLGYLSVRAVMHYAVKFNPRHIHTVHDVQLAIPSGRIIKGEEESLENTFWLTRLYGALNRLIFNSPQVVVSASKFLLDFYIERGFFPDSKKIVLLNPLQPVAALPHSPSEVVRFLYLGQVERHKGVLFLVETFKKFLQKHPEAKVQLIMVGGGALLPEVKIQTSGVDQIKVLGQVQHSEIPRIFKDVDATIFPSLCYENSPTIIGESLSFGVPVVAAQIGGVQLVQHGVNGYTFEAGSQADLMLTLERCLANKQELQELRKNTIGSVQGLDIASYLSRLLSL